MLRDVPRRLLANLRRPTIGIGILVIAAITASVPGVAPTLDDVRRVSGRTAATLAALTDPPEIDQVASTTSVSRMLKFRRASFEARPEPSPSPEPAAVAAPAPPPVADPGSIEAIIIAAAEEFGVDPNLLLNIARCESGLNPRAVNPAGYYGLFQFHPQTWAANGYGDIYDPVAQSRTAARMISQGGIGHWGCA